MPSYKRAEYTATSSKRGTNQRREAKVEKNVNDWMAMVSDKNGSLTSYLGDSVAFDGAVVCVVSREGHIKVCPPVNE